MVPSSNGRGPSAVPTRNYLATLVAMVMITLATTVKTSAIRSQKADVPLASTFPAVTGVLSPLPLAKSLAAFAHAAEATPLSNLRGCLAVQRAAAIAALLFDAVITLLRGDHSHLMPDIHCVGVGIFGARASSDDRSLPKLGCSNPIMRLCGSKLNNDGRSPPTPDDSGTGVGSFGPQDSGDHSCGVFYLSCSSDGGVRRHAVGGDFIDAALYARGRSAKWVRLTFPFGSVAARGNERGTAGFPVDVRFCLHTGNMIIRFEPQGAVLTSISFQLYRVVGPGKGVVAIWIPVCSSSRFLPIYDPLVFVHLCGHVPD